MVRSDTDRPTTADEHPGTVARVRSAVTARLSSARRRSALFDRVVRTALAYNEGGGDREAAALSYYGFLSIFPILLLAVAVLGRVMRDAQEVRQTVLDAVADVVPGASAFLANSLDAIIDSAEVIGVVSLLVLAYTGLGAVDVLRGALDRMFGCSKVGGIKGKLRNMRFAALCGVILLVSVALAALAATGATALLDAAGVTGRGSRVAVTLVLSVLTFGADLVLFVVLFAHLPDHPYGWKDVLPGAILAAIAWTILKQLGGSLLARSAIHSSARYGIAAAAFGLLLAINLSAKLTLFSAQWAAVSIDQHRAADYPPP